MREEESQIDGEVAQRGLPMSFSLEISQTIWPLRALEMS
jgi:hypothetical protein